MKFYMESKQENNPDGKVYAVYMVSDGDKHYVCDMVDSDTADAAAINELGLTLRSRLVRSKGKYAMLEGTIFNPERLLAAACKITAVEKEECMGGIYKRGYTKLSITADCCANTYLIFSNRLLESLESEIEKITGNGRK